MATAEQLKNLIKAHMDCDDVKFKTLVLQIAAYEAKLGHAQLANELKSIVNKDSKRKAGILHIGDFNPMLSMSVPSARINDIVVSDDIMVLINRILTEYRNQNKLKKYGLSNRRKILIEGNPGTGKTFTASVIATELELPLYTVQMDKVVTKFMGETSAKLRQVFDSINSKTGVYFFDEFDAIGADRNLDNEVGEARRILNSFLQFIELDDSHSLIIAATNNPKLLDEALFRRFDDVLHYTLPNDNEIERLFVMRINSYYEQFDITNHLINAAAGLSHAEIIRVCDDAIKESILNGTNISEEGLLELISERKTAYGKRRA